MLKFLSRHNTKECLEIGGVVSDSCHGRLKPLICVIVDGDGEDAKLLTKIFFSFLHGFVEFLLSDERVGIGGVSHSLKVIFL